MMKLKDKKIEILRPSHERDPEGFTVETLTPIAPPLWAYFRQLSGKEIYANATTVAVEQVLFTINWRDDVDSACVIRFRGVLYDVTRVDTFEGYREDLTVYARVRG